MDLSGVITQARDAMSIKRVFGEPYSDDGTTLIPVASIRGGVGGGEGESPDGKREGSGGGFGVIARPVGMVVLREGKVSWRPALDVNKIILGGQVVAVVAMLTLRSILKTRAKAV